VIRARFWAERRLAPRFERGDGAEQRVAHWAAGWAVEGDVGPQRRREAADALAAAGRRQPESLESSPDFSGLGFAQDERDASGGLEAAVGSDAGEQQALGPAPLARRTAGNQERLVRRCLCLTQAPLRAPGR
jgi:hypothetical protein